MKVYSIGFTEKNAEDFFGLIRNKNIKRLIDVRLNNVSQLAGFAKKNDLQFFLKEICDIEYIHMSDLAPTKSILDGVKNGSMSWEEYENQFIELMAKRNVERIDRQIVEDSCLLCSEHKPHHCHRRLVIEYLNKQWNTEFSVTHLY